MSHKYSWITITVFVLLLDRVSKLLVMKYLFLDQPVEVLPFLNFTFVYNPGAAFDFLSKASGWQEWFFGGLAVVISCFIILWLFRLTKEQQWLRFALALVLGGTLGNLSDRICYHHVIDFIVFYYKDWSFPAFNIADSAISIGAIMLMLSIFLSNNFLEQNNSSENESKNEKTR